MRDGEESEDLKGRLVSFLIERVDEVESSLSDVQDPKDPVIAIQIDRDDAEFTLPESTVFLFAPEGFEKTGLDVNVTFL
jgi:hypothetical protein